MTNGPVTSLESRDRFRLARLVLCMKWNSVHADVELGARVIKADADVVSAIGDGDAKAAADEKTVATVNHSHDLGKLVWLQTELPKPSWPCCQTKRATRSKESTTRS